MGPPSRSVGEMYSDSATTTIWELQQTLEQRAKKQSADQGQQPASPMYPRDDDCTIAATLAAHTQDIVDSQIPAHLESPRFPVALSGQGRRRLR